MIGKTEHFEKDGRSIAVYVPKSAEEPLPALYLLAGSDPLLELVRTMDIAEAAVLSDADRPFITVAVGSRAWNSDYTPWPAPAVFGHDAPFTGGAPEFLDWLAPSFISYIEERYPVIPKPQSRSVLGYSLAGLAALYALYKAEDFGACGCCSGSLWYDGWLDFLRSHQPRRGAGIYLSLGKNEEKTRNSRMASIGSVTREAAELFKQDDAVKASVLVWHDGGHFSKVPERVAQAMLWLNRQVLR